MDNMSCATTSAVTETPTQIHSVYSAIAGAFLDVETLVGLGQEAGGVIQDCPLSLPANGTSSGKTPPAVHF